jgi:hypothetical protein
MLYLAVAFASPWAGLVGLVALVPLATLFLGARRSERVARLLGLRPATERVAVAAAAIVALGVLVGAAAAQPVATSRAPRLVRADAQAWFVVDTSRSMLAAAGPEGPTRFDRAQHAAIALRGLLPSVEAGIASFTDRPVPNLFPTPSQSAFAATSLRALAINTPPPGPEGTLRSSSFDALGAIPRDAYFPPSISRRLIVVLTDGESRSFDVRRAAKAFGPRYMLMFIRFWSPDERVYDVDGTEESYLPDAASTADTDLLVRSVANGASFDESQLGSAAAAARAFLGSGPTKRVGDSPRPVPLAPWLLAGALLPLGLLLWRRGL